MTYKRDSPELCSSSSHCQWFLRRASQISREQNRKTFKTNEAELVFLRYNGEIKDEVGVPYNTLLFFYKHNFISINGFGVKIKGGKAFFLAVEK